MQKEIAYNRFEYQQIEGFQLVLGYIPGYSKEELKNQHQYDDIEKFNSMYYQIAEQICKESGIFVTALINKSRVIYPGCTEGERVYIIEGSRNPRFAKYKEEYQKAVLKLAGILAAKLNQTTFSITWNHNISYDYFTKNE